MTCSRGVSEVDFLLREHGWWILVPAVIGAVLTWFLCVRRVAVATVVDPSQDETED